MTERSEEPSGLPEGVEDEPVASPEQDEPELPPPGPDRQPGIPDGDDPPSGG